MRKIITSGVSLCFFLLVGCGMHIYQPNVQQGNLVSRALSQQIQPGMSKEQVKNILGEPVLANAFDENHWAYVSTFQQNGGNITRKNIDVYFQNNRVSHTSYSEGNILNAR